MFKFKRQSLPQDSTTLTKVNCYGGPLGGGFLYLREFPVALYVKHHEPDIGDMVLVYQRGSGTDYWYRGFKEDEPTEAFMNAQAVVGRAIDILKVVYRQEAIDLDVRKTIYEFLSEVEDA